MADPLLADLLVSVLRRGSGSSLQSQLTTGIRDAIRSGKLKAGARLPSSRMLAEALGVARVTVVNAYDKLLVDGYLHTDSSSGTFVADCLPVVAQRPTRPMNARSLSVRGAELIRLPAGIQERGGAFVPGVCDSDHFPFQTWKRIQNRYLGEPLKMLMGYANYGGYLPLRRALAEYLCVSRAVQTTPEQIIVTMGTNQSIDLCARVLADQGELAYIENPCYWATPVVLRACDLAVEAVDVDAEGMRVHELVKPARLVVITPSHQFPMGVTLSEQRRQQLLAYAEASDAYVLEDDYDSEFRYDRRPLPSLQGTDQHGRVIFMGTFSKVMFPGMRLSYIVVPPDLADAFSAASLRLYRPGHLALQASVADFVLDGHFAKHILRMREVYATRQAELTRCLDRHFGSALETARTAAGLHMTIRIADLHDLQPVAANALDLGIHLRRLNVFRQSEREFVDGFLLGFGAIASEDISPAVETLARIVERHLSVTPTS